MKRGQLYDLYANIPGKDPRLIAPRVSASTAAGVIITETDPAVVGFYLKVLP